jgi:hypothetical protein
VLSSVDIHLGGRLVMTLFRHFGIPDIRHYAPLHYLPFIVRTEALLSKPTLAKLGFPTSHLRAKSHRHDVERGFGDCAFLTLDAKARILKAKLTAGFPHIGVAVPAVEVEKSEFSLCRFNVAMTRRLRRGNKAGFPESPSNGRYFPGREIPIASDIADMRALLAAHYGRGTMIEVLIHGDLGLPAETAIICFSDDDEVITRKILKKLSCAWKIRRENPPIAYKRDGAYAAQVDDFLERSLADPNWRGNGLDFDRV